MIKERRASIDGARAILIMLVVIGHVITYANFGWSILPYTLVYCIISSFHMPAFFLLSGTLINEEKLKRMSFFTFLKAKFKTLIIPYIFFELIAILYKKFFLNNQSIYDGFINTITFKCNVGADWFLIAMFIAQIVYYIYIQTNFNKILWYGIVTACFFCMWFIQKDGKWLSMLSRGLTGFAFLFVGNRIKSLYNNKIEKGGTAYLGLVAALICLLICSILCWRVFNNSFFDCVIENPLVFLAGGISGLYIVNSVSQIITCKWLCWLGQNTLIVMGTHQLVLYTIPVDSGFIWVIGVLVLICAIEVPLIFVTNSFCPCLVGKKA